jgi:hypothetical protein
VAHRVTKTERTDADGQLRTTYAFARHEHANSAWHDLGQIVPADKAESIDVWRELSGLGYRFELQRLLDETTLQPATYDSGFDERASARPISFGRPLRIWELGDRAGEREPCGTPIVMTSYEATDPELIFREVLEIREAAIAAGVVDAADCFVDCAGSLRSHNRQFVTLRLPTLDVHGESIEQWLSRVSSCDSSAANSGNYGTLRVVCDNTAAVQLWLTKAMAGGKRDTDGWVFTDAARAGGARFAHRRGGNDRMAVALQQFTQALGFGDALAETISRLSLVSVTDRQFRAICDDLWPEHERETPDERLSSAASLKTKIYGERLSLLQQQWSVEKLERSGATGWSALQPITYVLSRQQVGGRELTAAQRLEVNAFATSNGDGKRAQLMTERAIDSILTRGSVRKSVLV